MRLSWTLPKRSTMSTWATISPAETCGDGDVDPDERADVSRKARSSAGARPPARNAAAGAKTSRPWNVRESGEPVRRLGQLPASAMPPILSAAGTSKPLSGADVEPAVAASQRDRLPLGPHTGVDDGEMNALGHVRQRVSQHERALQDLLRIDAVGDVDDLDLGRDPLHDAVARADEVVGDAEVA